MRHDTTGLDPTPLDPTGLGPTGTGTTKPALLVLGGADGALTTLAAARRVGLRTICVDMRPEAPGARAADEYLPCSTADVAAVVAAVRSRTDICAVMSPGSDVNLPYQQEIARALSLPCPVSDTAMRISTDKAFFHEVCADLGVRTPAYVAGSAVEVLATVGSLRWPVIVKPNDLGGGRGVVRCVRPEELAPAVFEAEAWSPTGQVIVEEFVAGRDCGAEVLLSGGVVRLAGITERLVSPAPAFTTVGHVMRPDSNDTVAEFRDVATRVCRAVGYSDGPANFDLVVPTGGASGTRGGSLVMIEMGTRLGGNGVGELLGLVHGVDTTELAVQSVIYPGAFGEGSDVPDVSAYRYAAARSFHADNAGRLVALGGLDEARALPGVVDVVAAVAPGDRVEPYTQCRSKAGFLLVVADDERTLHARMDRALATIRVEYMPDAGHVRARQAGPDSPGNRDLSEELAG